MYNVILYTRIIYHFWSIPCLCTVQARWLFKGWPLIHVTLLYLGKSSSPLALRTWGLAGVLLPDLIVFSFLLFLSIWSESADELAKEVFELSLLLRFTEPTLEKLVRILWLGDVGVLHVTLASDSARKELLQCKSHHTSMF